MYIYSICKGRVQYKGGTHSKAAASTHTMVLLPFQGGRTPEFSCHPQSTSSEPTSQTWSTTTQLKTLLKQRHTFVLPCDPSCGRWQYLASSLDQKVLVRTVNIYLTRNIWKYNDKYNMPMQLCTLGLGSHLHLAWWGVGMMGPGEGRRVYQFLIDFLSLAAARCACSLNWMWSTI